MLSSTAAVTNHGGNTGATRSRSRNGSSEIVPVHGEGVRSVFYAMSDSHIQKDPRPRALTEALPKVHCSVKLWVALEAVFLGMFLVLATLVCALWLLNNNIAITRMKNSVNTTLDSFDNYSKSALTEEVQREHTVKVASIYKIIRDMVGDPCTVVLLNSQVYELQTTSGVADTVTRNLQLMWPEIKSQQWHFDLVYYADTSGVYAGYRRLIEHDGGLISPWQVDYRPPDILASGAVVCPQMCPLPGNPGHLTGDFISSSGHFMGQSSPPTTYDPRIRMWYKNAIQQPGVVMWTGPYVFADGKTFGVTASLSVDSRPGSHAVFGADISFAEFSERLASMVKMSWMRMFIVVTDGTMIASSKGYPEVIKIASTGNTSSVRRVWFNETFDPMVIQPIEQLLELYNDSLDNLPSSGARLGDDDEFIYAWVRWGDGDSSDSVANYSVFKNWVIFSVQDAKHALQNVTTLREALGQSALDRMNGISADMRTSSLYTIASCVAFTTIGAVLLAVIAHSIVQPLKGISRDMMALARLEFMDGHNFSVEGKCDLESRTFTDGVRTPRDDEDSDDDDADTSSDGTGGGSESSSPGRTTPARTPGPSVYQRSRKHRNTATSVLKTFRCGMWEREVRSRVRIREVAQMRHAFDFMSNGLRSFARYMDPNIVQLLILSNRQARLGVAKAEVTVFFSDIANFTTMAEELDPVEFMDLLAEYLDEMSKVIMSFKGVVGEFIGDAIMAWWNAPVELEEPHSVMAFKAALAQQAQLSVLRKGWKKRGKPDVRVRMGLVCGTVLAGNIGSSHRMKFGLVGDSVNLASRLEGLCKRYSVSIIIEEGAFHAKGVEDEFLCRVLDLVIVKGRSNPTEIFELVVRKATIMGTAQEGHYKRFVDDFAAIHVLYRAREFAKALRALEAYEQLWPRDVPARMMRERCEALLAEPPGTDWSPVERLREK